MAAVIRELESSNREVLQGLIDAYYVRTHDGRPIQNEDPLDFINSWLKPDSRKKIISDPLEAIQTGQRFDPKTPAAQRAIDSIFNGRIPISSSIVNDFANWPMQAFWGYSPWELLQGYIRTADRPAYFTEITGEPASRFLNETERIFYLTHGYGRPNKYISPTDLNLRGTFMTASPTALIALSDLLGVCPTLQDPEFVLNQLSDIDLRSIDTFHRITVMRLTECLDQAQLCPSPRSLPLVSREVCTSGTCSRQTTGLEGCNPDQMRCFQEILSSIGILPIFEYDPSLNVFVSNLSQLGSYRQVVPDKKWSLDEVRNMVDSYVAGVMALLPDQELLQIEVPRLGRFRETIDLSRLSDRLRGNLVDGATRFLTQKQYFNLPDGRIGYGRPIDDQLEEMSLDDLEASLLRYGALIDPYEHSIGPETAEDLFSSTPNESVRKIIYKARTSSNEQTISQLDPQQRGTLIGGFEHLLQDDIDLERLEELLRSQGPTAMNLLLWETAPVTINFQDYFANWAPTLKGILKETLRYYIDVLST